METVCSHCGGSGFEPDNRAIGQLMRDRRQQRKLGLREMAGLLELSPSYLSDLETGRRNWGHQNLARYEAIFEKVDKTLGFLEEFLPARPGAGPSPQSPSVTAESEGPVPE